MVLMIRSGAVAVLLAVGAALGGPALGDPALADNARDNKLPRSVERVLDDGRSVITYTGGYYVGYIQARPDGGQPLWHGRCAFYFKAGGTFKGTCAEGKFQRGYILSEESVIYFDTTRDEVRELHRPARKLDL